MSESMRAVTILPGEAESARVADMPVQTCGEGET